MVEYTLINGITFALGWVFLYIGYRMVKRGRGDVALFLTMAGIGLGFIIVAVYPDIFEVIASVIGLEWKARAILIVSSLVQFILIIYLFHRTSRLYDKVSRLNEELSLLNASMTDGRGDSRPNETGDDD
ncbi:DUF2304 domain-containing protein [Natronomonas amylolytica]|uniref:DUF2304 domain-containing protein n=1 Tax=Natronomonas amylolytica TaxID=3108498 RepID=UPI00300BEFF6